MTGNWILEQSARKYGGAININGVKDWETAQRVSLDL